MSDEPANAPVPEPRAAEPDQGAMKRAAFKERDEANARTEAAESELGAFKAAAAELARAKAEKDGDLQAQVDLAMKAVDEANGKLESALADGIKLRADVRRGAIVTKIMAEVKDQGSAVELMLQGMDFSGDEEPAKVAEEKLKDLRKRLPSAFEAQAAAGRVPGLVSGLIPPNGQEVGMTIEQQRIAQTQGIQGQLPGQKKLF